MNTLYDVISIDNKSHNELPEDKKKKLDLFVAKLKEADLEQKILSLIKRKYDVSEQPEGSEYNHIHKTNLPQDLSKEIDKVWVHLND